ncbi:MAG TPA: PilZ domain-containing protein [Terracidiphilus sp.]
MYNRTRESFLSLSVSIADTTIEDLKALIEQLAVTGDNGLWMLPYRGVPVMRGLSPVDIVFLDEEMVVIDQVESYPSEAVPLLSRPAAGAVALPEHALYSSQTKPGDQLIICLAEEMESKLAQLATAPPQLPPPPPPPMVRTVSTSGYGASRGGSRSSISRDHTRQLQIAIQKLDEKDKAEEEARKKQGVVRRFMKWLMTDRRRALRHPVPGLVAYYWTGGAPQAYHVGDISDTGIFLLTEERWFPGTMILMTLQMTDESGRNEGHAIAVQTRVVRWDKNGVGLAFVPARSGPASGDAFSDNGASKKAIEKFIKSVRDVD